VQKDEEETLATSIFEVEPSIEISGTQH